MTQFAEEGRMDWKDAPEWLRKPLEEAEKQIIKLLKETHNQVKTGAEQGGEEERRASNHAISVTAETVAKAVNILFSMIIAVTAVRDKTPEQLFDATLNTVIKRAWAQFEINMKLAKFLADREEEARKSGVVH
jgi:DNA polymerase I-like protein with 3'-5' exonuclease and polymerase domains